MAAEFKNDMPLQFATHDEIVAEIKRRWSASLIVVAKDEDDGVENVTDWSGGKVYALGLAELAKVRIVNSLGPVVETTPKPDDDEE